MNILVFNWRDIEHPWAGGAERHIHELSKQWLRMGHKVTWLCGGFTGARHKEEIDKIRIIRVGNTYSVFILAPLYYLIRLRWRKYDLIIDTAHGIPFFTPFFTRRQKIIIIHHNHAKLWTSEWGKWIASVGRFLENRLVPDIYRNIPVRTLSHSSQIGLQHHGFKSVTAVPPGIDTTFFNGVHQKTGNPSIIYLGRLRKYKRVDMIIEMFGKLKREIPDLTFTIAGDGQDRARILELIRQVQVNGDLKFKGYISEEEKRQLLSQSWVLVFPSLMEGWGLVAMEAAASGTPTVGFMVPGVEDAVRNNYSGLLVRSKPEFYEALIRILKDEKLRTRLSGNAVKWAKKFTWEESARKFLEGISK